MIQSLVYLTGLQEETREDNKGHPLKKLKRKLHQQNNRPAPFYTVCYLICIGGIFTSIATNRGPVLRPVEAGTKLHVGDKIKVRIELRVDRDMDYVHMKDARATCFEPVNVLSEYKWQGALGYYESTKDASTSFFFDHLYKGTYVFEYPLFVSQAGNFSNGITSIQCMYAPEFSAHSEGIRISAE